MSDKPQKITCSACGTSPLNHKFLFASNVVGETLGSLTSKALFATDGWNRLADRIEYILFTLMTFFRIMRWGNDPEKAITGRSKLIWDEAKERGIEMQQGIAFGKPIELYRATVNGKTYIFPSLPIPPKLPQKNYMWLDDKLKLSKTLEKAGIPTPKSMLIPVFGNNANYILRKLNAPIIIKPKDGSRGRHTTTNIKNKEELVKAISLGRKISPFLVAQEHLFGSVYRATIVNGKLSGFFRADPPQVTGNGTLTVRELIEAKNKNHHERLSDIQINDDLLSYIEREGYDLNSVLPDGVTLNLSAKTGRMYGGYTKEMLPEVHPKMHDIFEKVAKVVDVPVAGFDLIIENPTEDPDTQRWGIIECNCLPFIDLHYMALEGTPINLAKNVWDLWNTQ